MRGPRVVVPEQREEQRPCGQAPLCTVPVLATLPLIQSQADWIGGGFPGSCLLAFWSSRAEGIWPIGARLWELAPLHPG